MYRTLKVSRSFAKERSMQTINLHGKYNTRVKSKSNQARMTTKEESYRHNQRRKRSRIIELIDINFANYKSSFITLTFSQCTELPKADKALKLFLKNARRLYDDFHYIATTELQTTGRIHYHLICNIPNKEDASELVNKHWILGIGDVRLVYDKSHLAQYITKDLCKQDANSILFNQRCYRLSQGLLDPLTFKSWKLTGAQYADWHTLVIHKLLDSNTIINDFAGLVVYDTYSLKADTEEKLFGNNILAKKRD